MTLLVLALAGCGRRGPLEPPPPGAPDSLASGAQPANPSDYQAAAQTANPPAPSPDAAKTEIPTSGQVRQPVRPAPVSPVLNSFPLDPLLH
ncbi:MAG TPA: lipoprotein [Methylovirgula sp.]